MKKFFVLAVIFALVFAACDEGSTPGNGNGGDNIDVIGI
jgi:hypothetical protein